MACFLSVVLRLCLGFGLVLGPMGVHALEACLHASLCACGACASSSGASCCKAPAAAAGGPRLVATPLGCACTASSPKDEAGPALTPHACAPRAAHVTELEHARHTAVRGAVPRDRPVVGGPSVRFRDRGAGPPGRARARGAARAAALGPRLL